MLNDWCYTHSRRCYRDYGWSANPACSREEPLAPWERELLTGYCEGEGKVTFTRTDGRTVVIDKVRVDSISAVAENKGVIGVEFYGTDRVVHVPFVSYWEVTY